MGGGFLDWAVGVGAPSSPTLLGAGTLSSAPSAAILTSLNSPREPSCAADARK